jgi:hypothetical protein
VVLNENWQVVWFWNGFDHLDVTRKAILDEKCVGLQFGCPPVMLAEEANDWMHSNAIAYSPADGSFILSMRHQDWVIKIDYADGAGTGDVIWRLGLEGDFTIISSDQYPWQSHQHDPNYVADNQIVLYDNGNTRCASNPALCYSRGQVYTLDETTMTASLDINANLGNYSLAVGSAQPLMCGTFHFDSGVQITPRALFATSDELLPDGSITYSLKIRSLVYRSFRMINLYYDSSAQVDSDSDGIPDVQDNCLQSNLGATVIIAGCDSGVNNQMVSEGCTMSDLLLECADGIKNHGEFVFCVERYTNGWKMNDYIAGKEKGALQRCAAQARIP